VKPPWFCLITNLQIMAQEGITHITLSLVSGLSLIMHYVKKNIIKIEESKKMINDDPVVGLNINYNLDTSFFINKSKKYV
jgi:hypothetical protein